MARDRDQLDVEVEGLPAASRRSRAPGKTPLTGAIPSGAPDPGVAGRGGSANVGAGYLLERSASSAPRSPVVQRSPLPGAEPEIGPAPARRPPGAPAHLHAADLGDDFVSVLGGAIRSLASAPETSLEIEMKVTPRAGPLRVPSTISVECEHAHDGWTLEGKARMAIAAGSQQANLGPSTGYRFRGRAETPERAVKMVSLALEREVRAAQHAPPPASWMVAAAVGLPLGPVLPLADAAYRLAHGISSATFYSWLADRIWGRGHADLAMARMRPDELAETVDTVELRGSARSEGEDAPSVSGSAGLANRRRVERDEEGVHTSATPQIDLEIATGQGEWKGKGRLSLPLPPGRLEGSKAELEVELELGRATPIGQLGATALLSLFSLLLAGLARVAREAHQSDNPRVRDAAARMRRAERAGAAVMTSLAGDLLLSRGISRGVSANERGKRGLKIGVELPFTGNSLEVEIGLTHEIVGIELNRDLGAFGATRGHRLLQHTIPLGG